MTRRRRFSLVIVATLLPTVALCGPAAVAQETEPEPGPRFDISIGLHAGTFDMINAEDSFDAVYGDDTLFQGGVQVESRFGRSWFWGGVLDVGRVDGERILLTDPPRGTGVETTLTYVPLHASVGWLSTPDLPWHLAVGGGITLVYWEDDSAGADSSGTDPGAHLLVGIRGDLGRFTLTADARYSTIPDAVGESGASAFYDEDDIGGLALSVGLLFRIR